MKEREIEWLRCLEMLSKTRAHGHNGNRWAFEQGVRRGKTISDTVSHLVKKNKEAV